MAENAQTIRWPFQKKVNEQTRSWLLKDCKAGGCRIKRCSVQLLEKSFEQHNREGGVTSPICDHHDQSKGMSVFICKNDFWQDLGTNTDNI